MVGDRRSAQALQQVALRRALAARDPGGLHLRFDGAVVALYRGEAGVELLRTRSVGRISVGRSWSLDVGIAPDGSLHVPFQDFVDRVPQADWPRWIEHLAPAPTSAAFIQMRLAGGACIDDGETVAWE